MPDPAADGPRRDLPTLADLAHLMIGGMLRLWVLICYRASVRTAAPLPRGPVLFACNHRSFLDPPMAGMWSRVPVCYFARASLWRNPIIGRVLDIFSGIPVDRDNPGASSMKGAIARLRAGKQVLVFPEGTRTRDGRLGRFKEGPALFARRAGVPVIPVYVWRTERCWPVGSKLPNLFGPRLEVRYGLPMRPPANLPPRQQDRWLMLHLEAWMRLQQRRLPH
jgi:1-acyl-sn-glycerol-3-phosphate acyltransferase